jgi:hypothetical protein
MKLMDEMGVATFLKMLEGALFNLSRQRNLLNALNIYPVPDGDTGNNLYHTLNFALNYLFKCKPHHIGEALELLSLKSHQGARGNSGIILASFFEGFHEANRKKEKLEPIDIKKGFEKGTEVAYSTILHPVEGTMLTAIRYAWEEMVRGGRDIVQLFRLACIGARRASDESVNLLPPLREVGVVDAGAEGFFVILEGFLAGLEKKDPPLLGERRLNLPVEGLVASRSTGGRFCMVVELSADPPVEVVMSVLKEASSVGILGRKGNYKIHLHTDAPDQVVEALRRLGEVLEVRREELPIVEDKIQSMGEAKLLALVPGDGFKEFFSELGAEAYDYRMGEKPSLKELEDLIRGMEGRILFLPNDSDIVPVAIQLQEIFGDKVKVIPTTSVPEGIMAILSLGQSLDLKSLKDILRETKCGKVALAERDGHNYKKGDYVGIFEKGIVAVSNDPGECLLSLLEVMDARSASLIHIFVGEPLKVQELKDLESFVRSRFGGVEVQVYKGGQPIYHFIVGVYS